jgi:selT/selW/selH-like putative selenoprotein
MTRLETVTLKPSGGGVFDVRVDGELVYSGLELGAKFPSEAELEELVGSRVIAVRNAPED